MFDPLPAATQYCVPFFCVSFPFCTEKKQTSTRAIPLATAAAEEFVEALKSFIVFKWIILTRATN